MITKFCPQVSVNNMSTIGSVWSPRRESLLQDPIPELMTHITTDMEVFNVFEIMKFDFTSHVSIWFHVIIRAAE